MFMLKQCFFNMKFKCINLEFRSKYFLVHYIIEIYILVRQINQLVFDKYLIFPLLCMHAFIYCLLINMLAWQINIPDNLLRQNKSFLLFLNILKSK